MAVGRFSALIAIVFSYFSAFRGRQAEMDGKPYNPERYQNQSGLVGVNESILQPMLFLIVEPSPSP